MHQSLRRLADDQGDQLTPLMRTDYAYNFKYRGHQDAPSVCPVVLVLS